MKCGSVWLFHFQEVGGAPRGIEFPERCDGPSWSEDVVVESLAVAPVVPGGVLNDFGVESGHSDAAESLGCGQQLVHAGFGEFGE